MSKKKIPRCTCTYEVENLGEVLPPRVKLITSDRQCAFHALISEMEQDGKFREADRFRRIEASKLLDDAIWKRVNEDAQKVQVMRRDPEVSPAQRKTLTFNPFAALGELKRE